MTSKAGQEVIFLVGAGASAEAGVCTSDQITEILTCYGFYSPSPEAAAIENSLRDMQVRIANLLQIRAPEVNFEHIMGTLIELSREEEYRLTPFFAEGDLLVKKLEQKITLTVVIEKLYALLRELLFVRNPVDYLYPLKNFLDLSKPLDFLRLITTCP